VLQVLGRHPEALVQYREALRLDGTLNNLCQTLVANAEAADGTPGTSACDLAYATGDTLGRTNRRLTEAPRKP
jgi:hypothetical protein